MPSRTRLLVTCCVKQSREKKIRKKQQNPQCSPQEAPMAERNKFSTSSQSLRRGLETERFARSRLPAPIAPGASRKRENVCVTIATTAGGQIHAQTPGSGHHGHRAQNLSQGHSLRCGRKKANTAAKANAERAGEVSSQNNLTWHCHRTTDIHLGSAMKTI